MYRGLFPCIPCLLNSIPRKIISRHPLLFSWKKLENQQDTFFRVFHRVWDKALLAQTLICNQELHRAKQVTSSNQPSLEELLHILLPCALLACLVQNGDKGGRFLSARRKKNHSSVLSRF